MQPDLHVKRHKAQLLSAFSASLCISRPYAARIGLTECKGRPGSGAHFEASVHVCALSTTLQKQVQKSDTRHATTPLQATCGSFLCAQKQADMEQLLVLDLIRHAGFLERQLYGSQATMFTCALPVQLMQQRSGKDTEMDLGAAMAAVRAALKNAPGKFRTVQEPEVFDLLHVPDPMPAEAPPPVPRVPPTSPFFQRSIQEEVAANTNRLPPAKEKAANEKASMVSSCCTALGMGPQPCCVRSASVGTQRCRGLLVLRFLALSSPVSWLPPDSI